MGEGERTEKDDPARFHRVFGDATRALEGAAIPYVLFGSVAAGLYGKPEQSGDIDLLIELAGGLFLDDQMRSRARRMDVAGKSIVVISPEDLLIVEAAANSPESQAHWYVPIRILMRTAIDWEHRLERARLAPRRIVSLLVYAQSDDIEVPAQAVRELLHRIDASA
jgi:predicted nucleotidyltransferase